MHPALTAIREAIIGTPYEHDLWLVGGAVRDELLGLDTASDFDLVTRLQSADLARLLWDTGVSAIAPVIYERFGTAMVQVQGAQVELVTARRESYESESRKPSVEAATLEEDAARRDFTVNTLMRSLADGAVYDPLGCGLRDLAGRTLRTPLDPVETFHDDPLRMLRAVRFRWKLGFEPADGLYQAIAATRDRLHIVSMERIREELMKMLAHPSAPDAMNDLMELGLFEVFLPEFLPMVSCEQGHFHHLDVWHHTLLVLRNVGHADSTLSLAALFHDVAKPETRFIDADGNTRFFGHETRGAEVTGEAMRRLKFPTKDIQCVASLVKNHMRLGSSPEFTASAARRLVRDLGDQTERLLALVEADASSLRPGIRKLDLGPVRARIAEVEAVTPRVTLTSPLSGEQIMDLVGLPPGPEVGKIKTALTELVLDGKLTIEDHGQAAEVVRQLVSDEKPKAT